MGPRATSLPIAARTHRRAGAPTDLRADADSIDVPLVPPLHYNSMPELPEVELAARSLRRWLVDRRIADVSVFDAKLAVPEEAERWSTALIGQECEAVERQAKYLLARFTGGHTLLAHLRMTGRFVQHTYVTPPPKSERFRLLLDDGTAIGFQDSRRFGRIAVHPTSSVD